MELQRLRLHGFGMLRMVGVKWRTRTAAIMAAALTLAAVPAAAHPHQGPASLTECDGQVDTLWAHAGAAARRAGIPAMALRALISVESQWHSDALSPANAQGLAQIVPEHHPAMRGRTWEPCASLAYAAAWLAERAHVRGDLHAALADYHSGPNRRNHEGRWYADRVISLAIRLAWTVNGPSIVGAPYQP